ncbi:single-stranded-DNA-specific exonuclease RecJ [Carnobacterium sp.]|uniref:single-stranded-DNA-specific exonuclease RecJ n=1 Tax=Carnobacterium sp. TaxID=48221 RepID=UPI003C712B16
MSTTKDKWKVIKTQYDNVNEIEKKELESKYTPLFISLCLQRGLDSVEKIQNFINPNDSWIHDPYLLNDMEKAVTRIMEAIEKGQLITVYGDYDADGITSTAVLKEAIEMIGGEVNYYIPNRFTDGYGPNTVVFEKLISEGTELILTCDNGVSGHEAISKANELGVDVVVTDHHELQSTLPDAYAIIHPKHPNADYPFKDLAGVGVAFKLATALLGEIPLEMLDLVAIGTIADLVSLTGENRALVKQGLAILKESQRIGLMALFKIASIKQSEADEETIGFTLAPRLNAVGRLGDAGPAVELLTTFDEEEALRLSEMINKKNSERQLIVAEITAEALEMVEYEDPDQGVYVLAKEGWHEGVLGIVASKVVSKTGKPAIILNIDQEKGYAKGSGRSTPVYHLYNGLQDTDHLLTKFGGHHMAAGLTLPIDNIASIKIELNAFLQQKQGSMLLEESHVVDKKLHIADVELSSIEEFQKLAPFGTDNPKPVFLFEKVHVQEIKRIGSEKTHLKLQLIEENETLDAIGFHLGAMAEKIGAKAELSVVGKLNINEWNGLRKPQLMLDDIVVKGTQLFDLRSTNISSTIWQLPEADYIFFNEKNVRKYQEDIPRTGYTHFITELKDSEHFEMKTDKLVLVDCPDDLELLSKLLQGSKPTSIYASFFNQESAYLDGIPSRIQFSHVFKYIASHKDIDARHKTKLLSGHLKIKENMLIFIINVFFEAGFVTIQDGIMNIASNIEKKELTDTKVYKKRLGKFAAEEILIYSRFTELEEWIKLQIKKES